MMRLAAGLTAAWCLATAAAAGTGGGSPIPSPVSQLQAEADRATKELEGLLSDVDRLRGRETSPGDPDRFAAERQGLRRRALQAVATDAALLERVRGTQTLQTMQALGRLREGRTAKSLTAGALAGDIQGTLDVEDVRRRLEGAHAGLETALRDEEADYQSACAAWRETRLRRLFLWGGALALLGLWPALRLLWREVLVAGQYRLMRKLPWTGPGTAYEAMDLGLRRAVVALRLGAADLGENSLEPVLQRFQAVAALKHLNIVELYSVLRGPDGLLLVFESFPGRTLAQLCAGGRQSTLDSARSVTRQVAAALDFAHGRGMAHGALSPQRIMIGEAGWVKLSGFGLFRAETALYRPPEDGAPSRSRDTYALAACVYEMLAGRPPSGEFQPPTRLAPHLPARADEVLRRALSPDPSARFASAGELARALASL